MPTPKRLLVFAGPNGSGKSTLTTLATLHRFGIPEDRYLNADDIARRLQTELPDTPQEERERIAFRKAREGRVTFRENGVSFAFETVFSHPSGLLDLQKSRDTGFEIVIFFVTTENPDLNVARVAGRVLSGGHAVPEERIRSRYERTMALLPRIAEESDKIFVYDSSGVSPNIFFLQNGVLQSEFDPVPAYLRDRLLLPLALRTDARAELALRLGPALAPDIEQGIYTGPLQGVSSHYVVQATAEGLIQHDRLLLPDPFPTDSEALTILYRQGSGRVQPVPPPR